MKAFEKGTKIVIDNDSRLAYRSYPATVLSHTINSAGMPLLVLDVYKHGVSTINPQYVTAVSDEQYIRCIANLQRSQTLKAARDAVRALNNLRVTAANDENLPVGIIHKIAEAQGLLGSIESNL